MDLTRRSAAGELSALFGPVALEHDKTRRVHRLRAMLAARLAAMDARERALLQAYADGVNAGLAQLGARPWQYLLLRAEPQPWQPVDSLLVIGEMFWMLQGNSVDDGLERAQWRECVGDDVFDWLEPRGGRWDAALDGSRLTPGAMPGAGSARPAQVRAPPAPASAAASVVAQRRPRLRRRRAHPIATSRSSAATTGRSAARAARPATRCSPTTCTWGWACRRSGSARSSRSAGAQPIRAEGVTLPGVPALVAGSNGHVAWGFTNSYGQWFDWIKVPARRPMPAQLHASTRPSRSRARADVTLDVTQFDGAARGREPTARSRTRCTGSPTTARPTAWRSTSMLGARDVARRALASPPRSGIPQQNLLVADRARPHRLDDRRRALLDRDAAAPRLRRASSTPRPRPRRPLAAPAAPTCCPSYGSRRRPAVDGQRPHLRDGPLRVAGVSTRHRRRRLRPRRPRPADPRPPRARRRSSTRSPWARSTSTTRPCSCAPGPTASRAVPRARARAADVTRLLGDWNGRADADQAGYRLVARCACTRWTRCGRPGAAAARRGSAPSAGIDWHARFEYAAEDALDEQPAHLLPRGFASWDAFLLAQVDAAVADMTATARARWPHATWGEANASHIGHVLVARGAGAVRACWTCRRAPQSGDAQHAARGRRRRSGSPSGWSWRRATRSAPRSSMPGGQSGHPMSPYYGAGHADWVAGPRRRRCWPGRRSTCSPCRPDGGADRVQVRGGPGRYLQGFPAFAGALPRPPCRIPLPLRRPRRPPSAAGRVGDVPPPGAGLPGPGHRIRARSAPGSSSG